MTKEEILELPAIAVRSLTAYKKLAHKLISKNSDLIDGKVTDNYNFIVSSYDARFQFNITAIKWADFGLHGNISFNPTSLESTAVYKAGFDLQNFQGSFDNWINIIKEYNDALQEIDDPYFKQFENELEAEFDFKSDDWDSDEAFDDASQIKIIALLTDLQGKFKGKDISNPEVQKLIEYTDNLIEEVPTLQKTVLKQRVFQIFKKCRKIGIKFLKDVVEVVYKESIMLVLKGDEHKIGDTVEKIANAVLHN